MHRAARTGGHSQGCSPRLAGRGVAERRARNAWVSSGSVLLVSISMKSDFTQELCKKKKKKKRATCNINRSLLRNFQLRLSKKNQTKNPNTKPP